MKNKIIPISAGATFTFTALKLPQSKIDPYTRSAAGMLISMGFIIASIVKRNSMLLYSGIGIGIGSLLTLEEVARLKGSKIISNQSNKPILILHETDGVKELKSYEIPDYRIDGLAVKGGNQVFKSTDGVYLKILADGTITETFGMGKLVNAISGSGLKSKDWVSQQSDRWKELLNEANK